MGGVPFDVYRASGIEPVRLEQEHITSVLLRRDRSAVIQKDGVTFNKIKYHGEGLFAHIGETVQLGFLETRPDFLYAFDANHGKELSLGKLRPAADAGPDFATAMVASRKRQIETLRTADGIARALRDDLVAQDELIAQLRGGIGDVPGTIPASTWTPGRGTKSSRADERERDMARIAASPLLNKEA